MKRLIFFALAAILTPVLTFAYEYESVKGDPMNARIYTLPNGLKVYIAQNPEQPRIQTFITVRAGGKNDPHESTGLAHYLEHLMFKGTTSVGSLDYEAERPLLDSIRAQYELYGHTTDPEQRRAIYHVIDSLSFAASQFAIANEYDKLMAGLGSQGSNAFTSEDATCYVEDIPSNEVDRWARIEADRFQNMVIRGFHTELEAVYEEYNISLTNDYEKVDKAINETLFPHHPYGQQQVIGTQEHLKNPSLENVLRYYHEQYVPNNMAICLCGDMENPDSIVGILDHYFGQWKPSEQLRPVVFEPETPLSAPVEKEVVGRESEYVILAWGFPGAKDRMCDTLQIVESLLSNGHAGLFDIDLDQSQQVLGTEIELNAMSDYSTLLAVAMPKEGQTLEQARDLMIAEMAKLRAGDFNETLLEAIINNKKRELMALTENNRRMAMQFFRSFIHGKEWKDMVEEIDRLSKITKQDVVDFANRHLGDGYVCVYKRTGEDPDEKKIDKPEINPIELNRDKQSQYVTDVLADVPHEVEPRFVDFSRDMTVDAFPNGNAFLYKHNDSNGLFRLTYYIDRGTKADPSLSVATQYIDYLGTKKMSADELHTELYRLACDIDFRAGTDRTEIVVSGLSENMSAAVKLLEDWLYESQPDKDIYNEMVADILKERADEKLEQRACFQRLVAYGTYGADNPMTHQLSTEELTATQPEAMLNTLRALRNAHQTVAYYGPLPEAEAKALLAKEHKMSKKPLPVPQDNDFDPQQVTEPSVIVAPYDAKNIYMRQYSNNGQKYSVELEPQIDLFNEYFGGGMNTVVFQELRESRGLAYSASAFYTTPRKEWQTNSFSTNIITQTDKMADCIDVFHQITEQMPLSEGAFELAKASKLKQMATRRTTRASVLSYYMQCHDLGLDYDPLREEFNKILEMTMNDLEQFHQQNVQGRTYTTLVLGDEEELDMDKLSILGPVQQVTLEDIFGY